VRDICERRQEDTGDLGILLLQHIFANEPEQKIQVKLHSGLIRLTLRGWLGVVASGCPKVSSGWRGGV
jgi:hypothetical protein